MHLGLDVDYVPATGVLYCLHTFEGLEQTNKKHKSQGPKRPLVCLTKGRDHTSGFR